MGTFPPNRCSIQCFTHLTPESSCFHIRFSENTLFLQPFSLPHRNCKSTRARTHKTIEKMLLKSSSTPVLGSLLPLFSESPSNSHHHPSEVPKGKGSPYLHHNYSKLSYSKHAGSPNLTTSLYNSSPISPSIADFSRSGFRRAQSEGNLEAMGSAVACNNVDEFSFSNPSKRFARRPHSSTLEAIPSFSFYDLEGRCYEDEGEDSEEEEDPEEQKFTTENPNLFHDSIGSKDSFGFKTEDRRYTNGYGNVGLEQEMYLARGLGVADVSFVCNGGHGGGSGGGEGCRPVAYDGDCGDNNGLGIEEHYKRLLEENPCNPLYLRNYAQFLYQTKRDLRSADEYYSRAILADPKDGEVLSQYANLVWEFYHDKDRATDYFERAVQASEADSHGHAAYASFLWETEDEDQDDAPNDTRSVPTLIQDGVTVP